MGPSLYDGLDKLLRPAAEMCTLSSYCRIGAASARDVGKLSRIGLRELESRVTHFGITSRHIRVLSEIWAE